METMLLGVEEVTRELARLEHPFKGVTFYVRQDEFEGLEVSITVVTKNADKPEEDTVLNIRVFPSPNDLQGAWRFHRFMCWRLCRIMSHEVREHYRIDGRPLFDAGHAA